MGVCQLQRLVFIHRHLGNIDQPHRLATFTPIRFKNQQMHIGMVKLFDIPLFMVSKGNFILPKHPPAYVDVITPLPNHLAIGLCRLSHLTMLKFLRKFNPVRHTFRPLPIDQLGRLAAEFFIIVDQFAQQAGQLLIQCSHVSYHFDQVFICQRFGNHLLVIGKHDQYHR